jgi:LmbE family N-acetylglucosaminyl deacetylase
MNEHPYHRYVSEIARLTDEGRALPLGGFPPAPRPALPADAPRVLIFSPHPDDECIVGGFPLRLLRQGRMRVIDVAVTQGSSKERQAPRLAELRGACGFLGFDVVTTAPGGLARINSAARAGEPAHWEEAVAVIAAILGRERPRLVVCPHQGDANPTHIGTHHLVMDALARQPAGFACHLLLTEFWAAMESPNLMVESSAEDVADLVAATAFHAGEVQRNPYHLSLPAWMQDNVRRGGELIGGMGGAPPDFTFATLYRLERWRGGQRSAAFSGGRLLPAGADPTALLVESP